MEALTVPAPGTVEHDDFFDSFLFQTNTPPAPAGEPGNGEVTAATAEGLPPAKSMDMLEALLDTNEEDNYTSAFEGGKAYSSARYAAEEASHHAECAVCFEPLCNGQTVVFINTDRQRICRHYFHEPCVKDLRPDNSHLYRCPLCRNPFAIVLRMPDPRTDPKQWFRLASTREGDTLDLQEVQEVLLATVNTDSELLDAVVRNKWKEWDRNNTGIIEWTHADGLFEFVRMNLPGRREKPPPAIARDRGAWFEFFDTNAKGFLTEGAVSRGIIKSFPSHSSASQLAAMVREVFVLFATKGNLGSPLRDSSTSHLSISKEDFLKEEGLADVIISALSYEGIPVSSYQDEEDQAIAEQLQQTINEGSEVFSAEEWECPACTYINKSTAETCTMCQSSRPKRKSSDGGVGCGAEGVDDSRVEREEHPVVEIEPPAEVAGWTCTVCTLVNMEEATVCVVCTTPRHGRVRERERERDRERERHHRDEENERPTERRRRRSQMSSAVSSRPSTPPPRALSTPAALYPPESQWEPDSGRATCRACSATFTFFVRRHHCRGCGLLYCGECAPQRPSSRNPAHTERLCQSCTAIITE
eukprot:TRINITY_DN6428_c0_g4_i1.p1 TRINITY_DN6428_c0_g4~~TRINITY_DN6428_c0_g4_i1.p1  ORF type:complete len:587 (+),score=105.46 TRINITY_DN6428_c0_g4_i1:46-1806(+)